MLSWRMSDNLAGCILKRRGIFERTTDEESGEEVSINIFLGNRRTRQMLSTRDGGDSLFI